MKPTFRNLHGDQKIALSNVYMSFDIRRINATAAIIATICDYREVLFCKL